MKKFVKILGFLGFFVTLATAQIGTAWAVKCEPGFYWSGELKDCKSCPGHTFLSDVDQGVYCPGGDFEGAGYDEGLYGCRNSLCGTTSFWLNTPSMAVNYTQCAGDCTGLCVQPDGCNSEDGCYPITDWVNGSATCSSGTGVCTITTQCETVECKAELCEYFDGTECKPNVNKSIEYRCSSNGPSIGTGYTPAVYGQIYEVNREGYSCTPPNGQNFRGWKILGTSYGPYAATGSENITWPCVNDPVIFVADFFGCPADQYLNNNGECKPCDTASGFHSQPGSIGEHSCQKSCVGECWRYDNPQQYYSCGTGETGQYVSFDIPGTQYEDWGNGCYYADNQNALIPDTDVADQECRWECGCSGPCYEEVNGSCVPKKFKATYECNGTTVHTDSSIEYLSTYPIANVSCAPQTGQEFEGWLLNLDINQTPYNNPDTLPWKWCSDGIFRPQMSDKTLYIEYVLYNGDFVSGNGPLNIPEPFTTADLEMNIKWTAERQNSSFKGWCDAPYYDQNATWLSQHCVETIASSNQWFQINNNNLQTLLAGDDTVSLYAWWECTGPYTLNSNYQCEGDKIDVKYTCHAPENTDYNDTSYIYSNAATYGQEYKPVKSVEEVTTASNSTACQFAGYEIDPDQANTYEWTLLGSTSNSPTNGKYRPGSIMDEWEYINPTPETEIEFELKSDVWKAKTYTVVYRCGDIKPGADVYTDSSATYGQTYNVAGQFDPFNGGNVTVQDFLDTNCKPDGGFGAWTFQNWTFTCAGTNSGPYNTNDPAFGTWTYDYNDCYFTANWAQTDFVIILDQNGATNESNPTQLYTRFDQGVYLDSARTQQMLFDSNPIELPKKNVTVKLYPNGNGASFVFNGVTYPNDNNPYASSSVELSFGGFYETAENSDLFINGETGFITELGDADGRRAIENKTWYAHWGTGTITLPSTATWAGHDFAGWACVDDENTVVYSCNATQTCAVTVSENITCNAQWSVACRSVSFDENGGEPTNGGNNNRFSKVSGVTGWYDGTECGGTQITPSVIGRIPTKTNGHFIGYNTTVDGTGEAIFNVNGTVTDYGRDTWAPVDNVTLYAQYECDEPYHLDTDPSSETWGQCVACAPGTFYDQNETDPAKQCKNCNQYISDNGVAGASAYTWTSRPPYNWSIKQCYRTCGSGVGIQETCEEVPMVSGHNEMEPFLGDCEGCTPTGKQISFYGNEFATDPNNRVNTCDANVGAINCPQGFLAGGASGANKLMAAAVDFYEKRDLNGVYELNGKRYIVGERGVTEVGYKLNNGFVWSQVVGDAQLEGNTEGNPGIISIIYPATFAPTVAAPEHHTFTGYGYPESEPSQNLFVNSDYSLTSGSDGNAKEIIAFANANNYQNMSPIIANSNYTRNLYANYAAADSYTLTYSCGDGAGTPPVPQSGIYAGDLVPISTPSDCGHYNTHSLTGWAVTATGGGQNFGTVPAGTTSFTWNYDQNVTFTAVWGNANQYSIEYENMTNATRPADHTTTMPDSYTYGVGATISGVPTRDNSIFSGWCTDSMLSNCQMEQTIGTNDSGNKTFWAKWECQFPYHLNADGTTCEPCDDNEFWDGDSCESCPDGWFSNPPYNWSINQCYKLCDGSDNYFVSKSCTYANDLDFGSYSTSDFLVQQSPKQIVLYGNYVDTNVPNVCLDDSVKYCPRVVYTGGTGGTLKLRESLVRFMKHNGGSNDYAGTRYIVGNRSSTDYDMFTDATKIWSHIVGDGQRGRSGEHVYTVIIYPTDTAPSPDSTPNPAFKGYFDGTGSNATQRVAAALGLDSSNSTSNNAIAFAQSPLLQNQIGDRILYPQYCANGETWNGQSCTGNIYTVKYICGAHGADVEGMSMENTATYDQSYKVAYNANQIIARCLANEGYVLKTNTGGKPYWKLNNTGENAGIESYTEENITWTYTTFDPANTPTFTAQYDCDRGYTWQDGECKPETNLCNADFPSGADSHAHIINTEYVNDQCIYTIQCAPCGDGTYGCYEHEGGQSFDITLDPSILVLPDTSFCTPKEYSISYNDTQRTLHFNVYTGTCNPTSYLYGNTIDIDCRLDAPNDSHAVFKGWCTGSTNTSTGCAGTQSISATDYGDKTYYAWWDCDQNYHQNGLTCDPDGNLPLIYKPNGGQPDEDHTVSLNYGQEFSTEGAIYTKTGNILARWDVAAGGANTFNLHFDDTTNTYYAELGEYYYRGYLDTTTTLNAHWEACQCDIGTGVASCNANVVTENACAPEVTCQTGYTNPHIECTGIYNTICRVTCDAEGQYEIILDKNFVENNGYGPHGNNGQTPLYTIHNTGVYSDQSRIPGTKMTQTTNPLSILPQKYYKVTFNHCDGDDQTLCSDAAMEVVNANIEFSGFYRYANGGDTYIGYNENLAGWYITEEGIIAGKGYSGEPSNYKWYADWRTPYGMLFANNWPQDPIRDGYTFVGWYTDPVNGTPVNVGSGYLAYSDTIVYARWERSSCPDDEILIGTDCKKKCWVNCTWNGQPTNPTTCPSDIANIPYVQDCTYNQDSPAAQGPGYHPYDGSTQCLNSATNQQITPESCNYTVNCKSPRVWDPNTSSCVYPSGTKWKIKFVCDTNNLVVQEYEKSVGEYMESIPSNTSCVKPGYSFTQWKDNEHNDTLTAGATNVSWTHEYNATYTPDRTQNIYHAHLNPYSYGQSNQSGTFGDAGVENLWERYGNNWYKNYNNGNLAGPMSFLNAEQLPTRTGGYSFAGYKTMDGYPRLNYADGRWNLMPPTTITDDEEWYAQWTQCTAGQYYLNGCQNCPPSHPNSDPTTATSMSDCYYSCSRCEANGCPTFGGAVCTYADPNSLNLNNGGVYYGTSTCTLLPGNTMPNCPYTVTSCAQGYQVNSNQTACEPIQTIVNYSCGTNGSPASYGVQMFNTATYGENYTVAQNDQNQEIQCTPTTTGYVLLLDTTHGNKPVWNLNYGTGQSDYTGHTFTWQYIFPYGTNPTFTAQYVCDTDNGYHLINGTCQKCPENSYWTGSQCKECDQGYHVNDAGDGCMPNTVNLNYITQCGTSNPQSSTCTFNTGFNLATHNTSTGYTFNGWTTNGNTYTGPFNPGQQIQCTAAYLGNSVYTNNATITITGTCTSISCPAQLPNGSHASMNYSITNDGRCKYDITCEGCTGCDSSNHSCYTNPQANSDGQFTVYGDSGDNTVLNNVRCEPTKYNVYYRCDSSTAPGTLSGTQATYGEPYYVESNGTTITCQSNDQLFNGWTFNGNNQVYYPGTSNYMINSWNYCNITPIFTASYGQCEAGQIYVPSLGKCRPSCPVPCTWAGYPANPAQCPTPQYPAGATCWYLEGNPAAQTGYVPEYDPNACLNPMTDATITPQTCNVDVTQNPTCPSHYHWNSGTFSCDPDVYTVTLDPNRESYQNNTIVPGSNNVNELKEKWEYGWSKDGGYQFATDSLILNTNTEVPYWTDGTKVFDGYWTTSSGIGYRMVQANGSVSQNGYQLLPATTITSDTTWYARYVDNPGPFTVTFRCDQDGAILNTQNPSFGDYIDVLAAPQSACTNHSGETFNQWRIVANGMLIPAWYNGTSGIYLWQLHEGSQIVPDWRPVYKVTLDKGATDAVNGNVTSLWDAVGIGWYTNSGLTNEVEFLSDSDLPTRSNYTFAGYVDSVSGNPRGQFGSNNTWTLPETTALTGNETWRAEWSRCPDYNYYENNQCKECDSNYHQNPHPVTHEDCYTNCQGYCQTSGCTTGQNHVIECDYISESYTGFIHWPDPINGQCPNSNGVVPSCDYCVRCEDGWVRDPNNCKQCIEDAHFIVTLNPHLVNNTQGSYSSPRALYTWHGKGVYLYEDYSQYLMNGNQNPLVSNPQTFATVTFNLNGDGAWLDWENQRRTDPVDIDVPLTYLGFYKSETDSDMVINTNRYIEPAGTQAGKTATANLEWHAHWQPRQIGTVTGSQLPQPSRPGFNFVGWFNTSASNGGTQIYATTTAAQNMTVYARWEKAKYSVNLDNNGGQWGSDPVYKLWESYGTGWSTEEYGIFNPNLTLAESQRPSWPGNSKVFNGYWTAGNNGTQQIRADGSVVDTTATVLTVDNTTWYAQYVDNTNKYTITFRCSENASPIHTYRVSGGESIIVPAKSECLNPGYSFTKWMGNQGTNFNARDSEYTVIWESFSDADFVPNWNNGDVYHVTLLQNDADAPGEVQDLYEKYASWWALDQNNQYPMTSLSGDQLPTKTGYDFAGFKTRIGGYTRGDFDSESNVWVPQSNREITNDEEWVPKWTQCKPYWYYDNVQKICKECPAPYTNNEHPESLADCYDGRCELRCIESAIECPTDPNAIEFEYSNDVYSGTNYYQNHCVLDIWVQQGAQQEVIPSCECTIKTCKPGYHPVNGVCVEYAKTDIMLNPNGGTWSSNVPSEYRYLYTIESTGVYRNSARTEEMTPDNNVSLHAIPSNGVSITLDANGGSVTWGGEPVEILNRNAVFEFLGFYNSQTPGFAAPYILPQEINGDTYAFITTGGQSAGMGYTTTPHTWYAQWNRSVTLPTPERQNYTFVGWTYNGELISNPWTVPGNATNVTLIARWTKNDGAIVAYKCDDGNGGIGGTGYDTQHPAYFGENYNVLPNRIVNGGVVNCSKPANIALGRRYHEFEDWVFSGNYAHYNPGEINWTFNVDNPTFNAHYKECPNGWYFDGSCKQCPNGYTNSDIDADSATKCYDNCSVQCTESCPQLGEPGVIGCIYPSPRPTTEGQEYYGSTCNAVAENCEVIGVYCQNGYVPTSDGLHCQEDEDNYHEITLDPNGGTVGQEKLYTIYNTGVYLDSARTRQMSAYNNYLTNLPQKNAVATFDCNPECSTPVSPVSVELVFNGYYERQSGGAKYINKFVDDGVAKGAITNDGNTAGKGYTANATWFAQWSGAPIGNSRWPTNPTRPNACATYSFDDWYTAANGGTVVSPDTPINSNVTWYAHWCESCPTGAIANGSCSDAGCVARFTCNDGYVWDADNCSCVLSPDTRFTLTYKPNGGTPTQPRTQSLAYGERFTTLGGDTFTKSGEVLCHWDEENHASSNTFPDAVAELSTEYTYSNEENITLLAHWAPCQCTQGAAGVQGCSFSVVNNACVPTVTCMPGYIPNGTPTCAGECNATCDTSTSCRICSAGTYQDGNECIQCPDGFTSNAGATSCYGNTITIDWDENGGNAIPDGSCVYGQTFTLANAPSHSNSAMQFLGWKLFRGDSNHPAGTNVMCTYDNVGVYSGTSTKIQAQWNECQCINPLNPHVAWCQAWFADGECKYMNGCDAGYEPDPLTVYTPAAVCNPKNYNITYNCGDGIGIPEYLTDSATFNENYTVKGRGTCQMSGFNFAGWKLSANNQTYQQGYRFEPWNFTQQNPTFTAQYSQCAAGEVWVDGACEPCTCSQDNWSSGVASCTASPSSISACSAVVTCDTGYNNPQGNCNGATCSAQCDQIQSNAIYVCGDGTTGTPPATETMNYGATHTVKGQTSCAKSGYTFNGWNFTGTNGSYNPGATVQWNYETNQTFTGNWCENCVQPGHGECSLNAGVAGMCSYNCNCNAGYTLVGGVCTAHPVCERSEYNITYRPNGGMNNGVLGQPVIQDVAYGVGFTTKDGTIFTKENSIVTAWDHIDGGNYPDLNAWYQYNTIGDTVLGAHWEQCTCTLGVGAESCGTLSTAGNACNWTNPVCQNGYVSPNMQCSGTGNTNCTLTCGECAEGEIIVDGQCVPCTCTTGTGAASCTPGATANNTCTAVGQCMVGYGNENGNANVVCSDTNCVVSYNECGDGWVSNENCQCEICPANTYQSGNTCVPCQNGYTSPAGSSSADACVPGAHTIHYLSNNGMNQTYDQSVTYGQSFVTEGGTRFTKVNNIMTHWNVESGPSNTFTNGAATLSGNYVYNDTTDTTLSAQWAQCECDAPNCNTYATDLNTCACNATCPTGYTYGGCECDGTVCEPICTLGGSNAIYKCGTGIGTGYSTYVNYGATHTILTNAFVGCYRDNSTFAGWAFNGDNNIYFDNVGATVTWDYTTDKEFEARWCSNCPVVEHGTNLLTIPEPGLCRCDLTCATGYHVENGACEPNVYPNENGITYKPNGGAPNRNYTQSVTYDAPFTTLGVVYSKARHILNRWDVESGGAGTFNGGYADLGREYTYYTDGATVLAADWTECATDEISLNNTCRQCGCTTGTGAASCGTLSTDDDTCTWGPVSCQTGYVTPVLDCLNDTTNCTASCTPCGTTQVEVNGTCTDCVCNVEGDVNGIISGCGFASNNGNTCNWNPTTCKLGYGNPNLTCDDSGYNNNCEASCTICPAGTYGDNGIECKQCPEGYTSLAGATSIRECFIDPNSCGPDEHIEHGECVSNTRACSIPDATSAVRIWNPAIGTYGPCTVEVDGCKPGYHVSGNVCVKNTETCTVEHGHGERDWNETSWGACGNVICDPGYEPNSDYTACVECSNRRVNGDIAVSGYIYECEIAACMYQGQKYALQNGECVPICEDASDETGTKVWDERTKKCIRTCNPGYKMW